MPMTARELLEMRNLTGVSVSPKGDLVAVRVDQAHLDSNTETLTWYVVPVAGGAGRFACDAGEPNVGFFGVPVNVAAGEWVMPVWAPDQRAIFYRALDHREVQIWRCTIAGAHAERVTDNPADVEKFALSPDGKTLYYQTGATRQAIIDAEQRELDRGTLLQPSGFTMFGVGRNVPINGRLAVGRFDWTRLDMGTLLSQAPRQIWALDLQTAETHLASAQEQASVEWPDRDGSLPGHRSVRFLQASSNGRWRVFLEPSASAHGARIEWMRPGSAAIPCTAAACTGDIRELAWSTRCSEVYFWREEGGNYRALYALSIPRGAVRQIMRTDEFLTGFGGEFYRPKPCPITRDIAVCIAERIASPPQLVALNLRSGQRTSLYDPNPDFEASRFGSTERLDITDGEGDRSFGYVVNPLGYRRGTRYPLIITQYRCPGFGRGGGGNEQPIHAYSARGFAVLCFDRPNLLDAAVAASQDIKFRNTQMVLVSLEVAVAQLARQGLIDPERVGITGLSNGAQNTVYAISHSTRFAAASIAGDGVDPILYYLDGGNAAMKPMEVTFGLPAASDPDADPLWREFSAALRADRMDTPLLMQSAELEMPGAMQLYTSLIERNKPVEAIVYANEYHQKFQPRHRLAVYERNLDWFQFWLQGYEDPDPAKREQYVRWERMRNRRTEKNP
jgi:dipeptidyl aminopeptidase/acylaminoacyl peptidase